MWPAVFTPLEGPTIRRPGECEQRVALDVVHAPSEEGLDTRWRMSHRAAQASRRIEILDKTSQLTVTRMRKQRQMQLTDNRTTSNSESDLNKGFPPHCRFRPLSLLSLFELVRRLQVAAKQVFLPNLIDTHLRGKCKKRRGT